MNRTLHLLIILLLGAAFTWWWTCRYMNDRFDCFICPGQRIVAPATTTAPAPAVESPPPVVPLTIQDGSKYFLNRSNDNFIFPTSGNTPEIAGAIQSKIPEIATYLKTNGNKSLSLTGLYAADESNSTKFPNLGIGRAEAIKQKLVAAGAPAAQISTNGRQQGNLNFYKDKLYGGVNFKFDTQQPVAAKPEPATVKTSVRVPPNIQTQMNNIIGGMSFTENEPGFKPDGKANAGINQMIKFLKDNPGRKLVVTGYYRSSETNNTKFENLGLARADQIIQRMVKRGVDKEQLVPEAKLLDKLGLNLDIQKRQLVDAEVAKTLFKPRTLYFKSGTSDLVMTPELEKYFKDMQKYLQQEEDVTIHLTGHTDNTGDANKNMTLGKKRADEVKGIIAKRGVKANRITTSSEGQNKPIADNNTEEGKQKNRRVEMVAKQK